MNEKAKLWAGGQCPEHPDSQIQPFYRGPEKPTGYRITCAPASRLDWSHDGGDDDITSYRVLFDANPHPPHGAA